MTTLPASLIDAHAGWIQADRPEQGNFRWRPQAWERRFSRGEGVKSIDLEQSVRSISTAAAAKFDGDGSLIDRELVSKLHAPETLRPDGADDPQAVATAYIAAMVWGYGTTGYGPYRTERVLTTDPDAVQHLCEVAAIAQDPDRGGIASFATIAEQKNGEFLKFLGPAFGTKFLYFLTAAAPGVTMTPVMDAVVRRWFAAEADISLNTTWWDTTSYQRYLDALDAWSTALAIGFDDSPLQRDQVELLIFASARGDDSSWTPATESITFEDVTTDQLLELLQEDIAELAEKNQSSRGPELLTALADWVSENDMSGEG